MEDTDELPHLLVKYDRLSGRFDEDALLSALKELESKLKGDTSRVPAGGSRRPTH